MFSRRLRTLALGLALLAALGQALLPLHATARALGEWRSAAGICSTDGLPGSHLSHAACAWCVLSSGALPGAAPAPIPAPGSRLLAPPPDAELLASGLHYPSAQPRAPPSRS